METVIDRIERFKMLYKTAFGVRKYENISSRINNSRKIRKLISLSFERRMPPHSLDYLYALNEIPYFMFSLGDTQALGAILALECWIKSGNSVTSTISEIELNKTFNDILHECAKSKLTIWA